jgi:hypothetical protein
MYLKTCNFKFYANKMVVKVLELPVEIGVGLSNSRGELDKDLLNASGYSSLKWVGSRTSPTP